MISANRHQRLELKFFALMYLPLQPAYRQVVISMQTELFHGTIYHGYSFYAKYQDASNTVHQFLNFKVRISTMSLMVPQALMMQFNRFQTCFDCGVYLWVVMKHSCMFLIYFIHLV